MRIEEIATIRTLSLNEIFDTKVDVKWKEARTGWTGDFELDDHTYQIKLDEYDLDLESTYSLVDFGFTRDGSWSAAHEQKSASRIFGAIYNAFTDKIDSLRPKLILFGIHYDNGSIESRKSLYDRLSTWYCRSRGYNLILTWVKGNNGEYCLLSNTNLTREDKKILTKYVQHIANKPK